MGIHDVQPGPGVEPDTQPDIEAVGRKPKARHAEPVATARAVIALACLFALVGMIFFASGFATGYLNRRPPVVRVVVRVRHLPQKTVTRTVGAACIRQLKGDIAGTVPWMAAHHYAIPDALHGYQPDESAC
jgi:hypothetical protein